MTRDFTDQTAGLIAALANIGKKMCHAVVNKMCFQAGQEVLEEQQAVVCGLGSKGVLFTLLEAA